MSITRKKKNRIITVFGKRWFDRVNGNTYFSVEVWVDRTLLVKWPYEYGYGDQYLQRAGQCLVDSGVYTKEEVAWGPLSRVARELRNDALIVCVADVATKKDL